MELTVYSSAWCPDCREAKRFLAKHNISYKEIDVETTPGAVDEIVKRTGKRAVPQFVIDGEWVQPYRAGEGFLYEAMSKRLGIKALRFSLRKNRLSRVYRVNRCGSSF